MGTAGPICFACGQKNEEIQQGVKAGQETDGARANCVTSHFIHLTTYWTYWNITSCWNGGLVDSTVASLK